MATKQVGIAELKSRLSEYLRTVRRGETIYVLDRETPVAQSVPVRRKSALRIRKPAPVDASVLLRLALGQPDASREWRHIHQSVSSALITVESLRTGSPPYPGKAFRF